MARVQHATVGRFGNGRREEEGRAHCRKFGTAAHTERQCGEARPRTPRASIGSLSFLPGNVHRHAPRAHATTALLRTARPFRAIIPKQKLRGAFARTRCSALLAASRRHLLLPHPTIRQHPLMLLVERRRMPGCVPPARRSAAGRWGHALGWPIHNRTMSMLPIQVGDKERLYRTVVR